MNLAKEAQAAFDSGQTSKTGNEIHWKDASGDDITVEILDSNVGIYVVRRYRDNGQLRFEHNYQDGRRHGKCLGWYENGKLQYEDNYQNGQLVETENTKTNIAVENCCVCKLEKDVGRKCWWCGN